MPRLQSLAVLALCFVAFVACALATVHTHTAPTDQLNANFNSFTMYKQTTKDFQPAPTYSYWASTQYNVQVVNHLEQHFVNFNDPSLFYAYEPNSVQVLDNRSFFYDPSQPNYVFIYAIIPKTRSVSGAAIYFSNFDYFYCGAVSAAEAQEYQAQLAAGGVSALKEDECTLATEPRWSTGYLTAFTNYYHASGSTYASNMPRYQMRDDGKFMYAGLNTQGELFYTTAVGRSNVYPSTQALPTVLHTEGPFGPAQFAIANVTTSFYPMNNANYGWTIEYQNKYFSVRSIGGYTPVCSFWNLRTMQYFPSQMYAYNADNTYFAFIPKDHEIDGFIATCTVKVQAQASSGSTNYAYIPTRVHDIDRSFGFTPTPNTEFVGAQASLFYDYQQTVQVVSWN